MPEFQNLKMYLLKDIHWSEEIFIVKKIAKKNCKKLVKKNLQLKK